MGGREACGAWGAERAHALALTRELERQRVWVTVDSLVHGAMGAAMASVVLLRRTLCVAPLAVCLLVLSSQAEPPIDPLRLADSTSGQLVWKAALGYSASGREGLGIDESGGPYTYVLMTQNWTLSVSAAIGLNSATRLGASITLQRADTAERRRYAHQETDTAASDKGVACGVWQQLQLDAASEFDPRLTISAGYPASGGFMLSGSILRDPIVLTAEAGLRCLRTLPAAWLSLNLEAGFVANSRIQIAGFMGADVPIDIAGVPTSRIGCEVRYAIHSSGRDAAVRASLVLRGERPSLVGEFELSG